MQDVELIGRLKEAIAARSRAPTSSAVGRAATPMSAATWMSPCSSPAIARRRSTAAASISRQAALDVASHIVSHERLGEPHTNTALFALLQQGGWLSPDLARTMQKVTGFRNVVVRGYQTLDLSVLKDIVTNRLDDLLACVEAVRDTLRRRSSSGS